jgi:hypothetical protein
LRRPADGHYQSVAMAKGTTSARRRLFFLVTVGIASVLYGLGYVVARRAHLLVHEESCVTGHGTGLVVDEHGIRRGDPGIPMLWSRT